MVYENALNNIKETLWSDDQRLAELKWYNDIYDMMMANWTEWLGPKFSKNLDLIKKKRDEYQDVFSKRNVKQNTINEFNKRYWWTSPDYSWDNLSTALPKMSNEYDKNHNEIINKIESLGNIYWDEKAGFFDKIQSDHDALSAWVLWQAQEQTALTEWLSTRRWMWTKAMEDVSKATINNATNKALWEIDASETAQLKEVSNLYNQLLSNLIQQYKETKDKYVLEKIQNAVNVLNALWKYWSKTAE